MKGSGAGLNSIFAGACHLGIDGAMNGGDLSLTLPRFPQQARLGELAGRVSHPQADADGRGDACTTVATPSPLPRGEGQGEGLSAQSVLERNSAQFLC